ncbi:MAG TPA: hypothetical protein VFB38_05395 [Chthonomonadaceae bacterium]|nr:hypothetical protein [Chthonomonadaceae bacterium]
MQCRWSDLGDVEEPGEYQVDGVGIVHVLQKDMDTARDLGGDPTIDLIEIKAFSRIRQYRIGPFTPHS